ncbi:MAG: multidrug efflux RND transporter permease subunit [Bryobacteraceae bacterium]|nr:multidrug efflux RND transporter permease subunit [Bryobacteraceae bacterium]
MIARFFINRPVFATVLSVLITVIGLVTIFRLPIDRYPQITPPTVRITAQYLGASAEVVEQTVATPIEQQLNGVEHMLYFDTKCTNDGRTTITATFEVGTNLDLAAVQVQNRVALAEPQLPDEVRRQGISVRKQSTSLLMVLAVESPDNAYDTLFLSNYTKINIRDGLGRIYGVGDVQLPGEREYGMRIWLKPDAMFKLGLTTGDVIGAIREQNVQAAAGRIGQSPSPKGQEIEYTIRAQGRLKDPEEFQNVILRSNTDGSAVRVKDVARVELGAFDYSVFTRFNGKEAVNLLIFQLPGTNAVDVADQVKKQMDTVAKTFPAGMRYRLVYDSTNFIRASIEEVLHTLLEAILLVILVVFVFLQGWRATLIPLIAVPVSLIGAFIFFPMLGFTINVLTLFGLVLAIGIVVDDAIVVVEAVEHHIERGLSPKDAALKAMEEVSGAIVAIALVLVAVFLPVAFLSGITGQLYRQFALTIAVSVVLSAINALTLSAPLCALLLKKKEEHAGGWLAPVFRRFNTGFDALIGGYSRLVRTLIRRGAIVAVLLLAILGGTGVLYQVTPTGFLPSEDEGWFIVDLSLPNGASLQRTQKVMEQVEAIIMKTPGVADVFDLGGSSFVKGDTSSSVGTLIAVMKPWDERKKKEENTLAVVQSLQMKLFGLEDAFILVFNPPPISGLGNTGGFNMKLQDRSGGDIATLARVTNEFIAATRTDKTFAQTISTFVPNEPQLRLEVDRERARSMGVPIVDIYQALQTYLGGLYVNDFNLFGRTYRVVAQAEPEFRRDPNDINRFYVRSPAGKMIPLSVLVKTDPANGPLSIGRYNLYRSADILGGPAPGFSTGQAIAAAEALAAKTLPPGFGFEWTGMSYQEKNTGSSAGVFAFSLLMVFLLLAAQYESWIIPMAVIFGVPAGVLGAIFTEWFRGIPDDVYCRVGLIMLIGLAAKNAILIIEFARQRREEGASVEEAAIDAARLRFRPILMTSFAFILGVVPLVRATGAGSASRQSLGSAVFGGMLAATIFGVFMIPTFYVWFQKLADRVAKPKLAPVAAVSLLLLVLSGCKMGPNFKAPTMPAPPQFRGATALDAQSFGDLKWVDVFADATLRSLVDEALKNNYDLRIAAQRIEDSRAQVTVAASNEFPFVNAGGNLTNRELATIGNNPLPPNIQRELTYGRGFLDMAFQLDFWGRYRRLTEAARAQFLAQEYNRRALTVSLISDVASNYFQLLELDRELDISRRTLDSRRQSLKLVLARRGQGVASGLDVAQAENLVYTASARVPVLERSIAILENALSVLLGRNPGEIPNRGQLIAQAIPPAIPAGLPSSLLERRPDLRAAEANLRAANARIGVARASLLPQFSLTGNLGLESFALTRFLDGEARNHQVGPGVTVPLFNSKALLANVKSARAQTEGALLQYELGFQTALRETADALVTVGKVREQRGEQEKLVKSLTEANRLSRLRYSGGVDSYLQVLDAERNLFESELVLAQVQRDELLAVVRLYRALGGGWQP